MITPAPTSKIGPKLARGVLAEVVAPTATKPGYIRMTFLNTNYELHLLATGPIHTPVGKRLIGTIHAKAKRIDTVDTGGRYVEPVYGRPRRVQGTVVAVEGGEVVVDAGMPIHCTPTDARQQASGFAPGDFVSFDVLDGAEFRPTA
ncbi:MAG: hypothetical protein ACKVU4_00100 [Phycisphaerales bacterium]